jgi:hypothetical protein
VRARICRAGTLVKAWVIGQACISGTHSIADSKYSRSAEQDQRPTTNFSALYERGDGDGVAGGAGQGAVTAAWSLLTSSTNSARSASLRGSNAGDTARSVAAWASAHGAFTGLRSGCGSFHPNAWSM